MAKRKRKEKEPQIIARDESKSYAFQTVYWRSISEDGVSRLKQFNGPEIIGYAAESAPERLIYESARYNALEQIATINDRNPKNNKYHRCDRTGWRVDLALIVLE